MSRRRRSERCSTLFHSGTLLWIGWISACASSGDSQEAPPEPSAAVRRLRMLHSTEGALEPILAASSELVSRIRESFDHEMDRVALVSALDVVDPVLERIGERERAEFADRIEALGLHTVQELNAALESSEEKLWAVARGAGELERGSDPSYRSGYRELDEMVEASIGVLEQRADRNGIQQKALYRQTDRLSLQRVILHDVGNLGRALLFLSEPRDRSVLMGTEPERDESGFPRVVDAVRSAVAFVPGLPNEASGNRVPPPMIWRQAHRTVVRKAGVVMATTPWELESSATLPGALEPIPLDAPGYAVSKIGTVAPQCEAEGFSALRNHELAREFRTALEDVNTGELLVSLHWQLVWNVDYRGQLRVQPESRTRRAVDEDPVLWALLHPESTPDARSSSVSDSVEGGSAVEEE